MTIVSVNIQLMLPVVSPCLHFRRCLSFSIYPVYRF